MRAQLCDALVERARNSKMLFLTGDLGFMALEPLKHAMGERFINAGVSEQNMISVSAALAAQGFEVWVYSIAPFCYARPFEQIRNDITFHGLPVNLIGNGGGYGYGVQGPTHHAIEDYGTLLGLPNLEAIVPTFDEDVAACVTRAAESQKATYLRLGKGETPKGYEAPPYASVRQLTFGHGISVLVVGPLAGTLVAPFNALPPAERPSLWSISEMPINEDGFPSELIDAISSSGAVAVVEEHVPHGGFASDLLLFLAAKQIPLSRFEHICARSHLFDRAGSQSFLRKKMNLDVEGILAVIYRANSLSNR